MSTNKRPADRTTDPSRARRAPDDDFDELLRETLRVDEDALLEQFGEPSLRAMVGHVFESKLRWILLLTGVLIFVFFVLAVYCGVHFFQATEVMEMMRWGAGLFLFAMSTSFIKIFHWLEMERYATVREIKRVELRVVQLADEMHARWGGAGDEAGRVE